MFFLWTLLLRCSLPHVIGIWLLCAMSNPGAPGSEAEVEELEQAFEEMDQDFEKLVLKRKAATVSIAAKARALIAHAKQESEDIINEAKAEAEIILAGAAEESKKLRAEQVALVQDAKKQAESILAGAVDEINRLEAEKTAFAGLQQPDATVMLNIGSTRFETSLTTLCRFPNSMIGCMFSGRHALPLGKDEHFFIDRDGRHFYHILNFLRSPEGFKVGLEGRKKEELRRECEYYGIDQLMFGITYTEKELQCYDTVKQWYSPLTVLVEYHWGVYTLKHKDCDDDGRIEYCPRCHKGICRKGGAMCVVVRIDKHFEGGVVPAAQPRVQGPCRICDKSTT